MNIVEHVSLLYIGAPSMHRSDIAGCSSSTMLNFLRNRQTDFQSYMPQYRGTPGPKRGSGWVRDWRVGMGDLWDSIENVNEENT
jgi:hypothetical protein